MKPLKKHLITMSLAASLFVAGAHADIPGDIAAGLSVDQIVANAQGAGIGFGETVAQIAQTDRGIALSAVSLAIQNSPDQVVEIVTAVAEANSQLVLDIATMGAAIVPESAEAIALALQAAVPQVDASAIQIAVASGVEQAQQLVTSAGPDISPGEATAAGTDVLAPPPPPVTAPNVVTPPSVSPN